MSAQTWRVVLASGEVREVVVRAGHSFTDGVGYFARLSPTDTMAFGAGPRGAVLRLAVARYLDVREILSPGEPTRAELTAERDEARAHADRRALALDAVRDILGATEHEGAVDAAKRVVAQRDTAAASVRQLRADVELATTQRDEERTRADNAESEHDAAWTAGAEAMRRGVDSAVADAAAWADYRSQQHASPDDDEDATHAQAHALDAVLARIRALTVPTRPEVLR